MTRNPAAEKSNHEYRTNTHAGRQAFCQQSRRADSINDAFIGELLRNGTDRNYQSSRFDSAGAAAPLRRIAFVLWLFIRGYRRPER
jgi:hypothetical protein